MQSLRATISLTALALLAAGCTAGQVTAENGGNWTIASAVPGARNGTAEVSFQSYNDANKIYTTPVVFNSGEYGSIFSFDGNAPSSAENTSVLIPSGDYIVRLNAYFTLPNGQRAWRGYCSGGILHHRLGVQPQADYWVSGGSTPTTLYRLEMHEGYDTPIDAPEIGGEYNAIPMTFCDP